MFPKIDPNYLVSRCSPPHVGECEVHARAWVGCWFVACRHELSRQIKCGRGDTWVRKICPLQAELCKIELIIHVFKFS